MIGLLTNLAPILFGFVAKIIALNVQAKQEQQKLLLILYP